MSANGNGVELRDYIRVVFARIWWILFITLGVVGAAFLYSFYKSPRVYEARNEVRVTDRFAGRLAKDMGAMSAWIDRVVMCEANLKRVVPAREIIDRASTAVAVPLGEDEIGGMVERFDDEMKVVYSKEGSFFQLSYAAKSGPFAAAVVSVFMKRMISDAVNLQVQELNNEVTTLSGLRSQLAADVAEAQRHLDSMKTVAPELMLTAATMAVLKSGQDIGTLPSTETAVGVYLELQRNIIMLDSDIADRAEQAEQVRRQVAQEPESIPSQRKLETLPAVREATKRRDELKLELAGLLANSTAEHPMVRKNQAELAGLDAFLRNASTQATVETVFEANSKRKELQQQLAALQRDMAGLRQRRVKMEESSESWRRKLDEMPSELRVVREALLDYEKKSLKLSQTTDQLMQAQIRWSLQLDQVGSYYTPQWEFTPMPGTYRNKHLVHLMLGLVLGAVLSIFAVYALEFADHSVKDQRDIRLHTKAAVLGVISDYNQMKAVAAQAMWAKTAGLRQYGLAALFVACAALLCWATWRNMPRHSTAQQLPGSLSAATVTNIQQAMRMYGPDIVDLDMYPAAAEGTVSVVPAVSIPSETMPEPALSE